MSSPGNHPQPQPISQQFHQGFLCAMLPAWGGSLTLFPTYFFCLTGPAGSRTQLFMRTVPSVCSKGRNWLHKGAPSQRPPSSGWGSSSLSSSCLPPPVLSEVAPPHLTSPHLITGNFLMKNKGKKHGAPLRFPASEKRGTFL